MYNRIQAKLAAMYFETRDFTRAMALTEELLREVKKLDDKPLLVEIHLVESRTHHQVEILFEYLLYPTSCTYKLL
jgi:26S proteasome regulatory subunit N6